jgi:hypothetical protein
MISPLNLVLMLEVASKFAAPTPPEVNNPASIWQGLKVASFRMLGARELCIAL